MGRCRDRVCLEDGRKLDLNSMARMGIVRPGAIGSRGMHWSYGDEVVEHAWISFDMSGECQGWLRFYSSTTDQQFTLRRVPRHFGGGQWYFLCPATYRRVSVLWRPPGASRFASRQAWGRQVAYRSQFEAPHQRVLSQGQALRVKLGGWEWAGYCGDDPPKPKWMRWKTYNRILDRSYEYVRIADALLLSRWGGRLNLS